MGNIACMDPKLPSKFLDVSRVTCPGLPFQAPNHFFQIDRPEPPHIKQSKSTAIKLKVGSWLYYRKWVQKMSAICFRESRYFFGRD